MNRIALIEDHSRLADLVRQALGNAGIETDVFHAMEPAWLALRDITYGVVVIDRGLPDGDGLHLVKRLRAAGRPTPCLMLTARDALHDRIEGLDSGADDYLTKPFSVDELLARVRANLRRSSMASSESTEASTFDNGPLHIDYAAGYATKDGRELSLTPTEYKLLVLLAKNVDKVLTHTFITREIWGTSWDSDLASLRVFMRTLRKKIEADPSHPKMIQTHMGVGYRMQRL